MAAAPHVRSLLTAIDKAVGDAHARERFGDVGQAFSAALGSWLDPLAEAASASDSTARSRAAARAMADLARLTGAFAGEAARSITRQQTEAADTVSGRRYAEIAGRIDDSFREFSSGPEFDRARRSAATAVLDWLEHDRATARRIARALEPPAEIAPGPSGDLSDDRPRDRPGDLSDDAREIAHERVILEPAPGSSGDLSDDRPRDLSDDAMPPRTASDLRGGDAALAAYPGAGAGRASLLVVPGFTTGLRMFDLDPQRSVVRTLAENGVDTWLLDRSRCAEADRRPTVASQIERIDRAVDAVREAANGRRPALAGHFHGGLLALLYCLRHPGKAGALITVSTPVRFASSDDAFAGWLRACDGERMVDVLGDIPGPLVAALVAASSPMRWCGGGFLELLSGLDSPDAARRIARFEQARRFPPAFPGETFRGLYRAFYRDDAFATGRGAVIDGHRYELSGLETPLLNVFARDDRIVPAGASAPLPEWAGVDVGSNREHPGGHYELVTGHRAHAELLPGIAGWLAGQALGS